GRAFVLDRPQAVALTGIAPAARDRELDRASLALHAAATELQDLVTRLREAGRTAEADIVETGVLMAEDPGLIGRVESLVLESGLPAEAALAGAAEEIAMELANLADPTLALLVLSPDAARVAAARADEASRDTARTAAREHRLLPAETRDGHRIVVLGNAASVAEVIEAGHQGAEGVGLLRTELGFLEARAWPLRGEHLAFLKPILERLINQIATVRLLDFGGDKTPPFLKGAEGRGIELLLESPEALRTQLEAIVAAGGDTQLRILIPMVTSPEQVRAV